MKDAHLISAALSGLGDTPDLVAASLWSRGVSGHRGSVSRCPLARFIRGLVGDMVHVSGDSWALADLRGAPRGWHPLPDACVRFVVNFDCGAYPHMQQGSVR